MMDFVFGVISFILSCWTTIFVLLVLAIFGWNWFTGLIAITWLMHLLGLLDS
jgi:hypothetical protein